MIEFVDCSLSSFLNIGNISLEIRNYKDHYSCVLNNKFLGYIVTNDLKEAKSKSLDLCIEHAHNLLNDLIEYTSKYKKKE